MNHPEDAAPELEPLERFAAIGLAAGRLAIGAGLWAAPRLSARALGFRELDGPALALARIAATRDLVLGAWQLSALDDPSALRRATLGVAAADAGDALTFALAIGRRETRSAGARGLPAAAAATVAGMWLADRLGAARSAR
jgi:hypothetical protein